MDVLSITPGERTIEMHHPRSEAELLGIRITLKSLDDDSLVRMKREFTDEYLKLNARNKVQKSEQIEANTIRLMTAAITNWVWYNPTGSEGDNGYDPEAQPHLNGETNPPCNPKYIAQFLANPHLRKMITEETEDTKAFFDV